MIHGRLVNKSSYVQLLDSAGQFKSPGFSNQIPRASSGAKRQILSSGSHLGFNSMLSQDLEIDLID